MAVLNVVARHTRLLFFAELRLTFAPGPTPIKQNFKLPSMPNCPGGQKQVKMTFTHTRLLCYPLR